MSPRGLRFGVLWALCALAPTALALEPRPHATAARAEVPPQLDGRLDDPVWQSAEAIHQFYQVIPVEAAPPSQKTEVRVLHDADFIYFGIRCYDTEPDKLIARRMLRDDESIRDDDRIVVVISPLSDERNGYSFQVNALGARRDALVDNSEPKFDWDGIWYAKAQIDDQGFALEIAIPFKSLNVNPEITTWGMQFFRGIGRNKEWIYWASPYQSVNFFNMATHGYVHGIEGIEQGLGLDVVTNMAARHYNDGLEDREYSRSDPGLDLFYRITPSLSGSFTANTDFGETEVDERRINLSRFALFFPEKRRFFLKDFGIFDFADLGENGRPFFSRRIGLTEEGDDVDLRVGGKVTGRVGRFNIGLLDVQMASHRDFDSKNLAVGRLSMNILEESTAGVIFTRGDQESNDDPTLYGADLNLKSSTWIPGREIEGNAWFQHSHTPGMRDEESAYGGMIRYPNDIVNWRAAFKELQESFNPALGFVNRVGIRDYTFHYRYRIRPQTWLRTIDSEIKVLWITDTSNEPESSRVDLRPFWLENEFGDRLEFSVFRRREVLDRAFEIVAGVVIPPGDYSWDGWIFRLNTGALRTLSGGVGIGTGGFYDGDGMHLEADLSWRPSRHLALSLEYSQDDIDLDFDTDKEDEFTTRIARVRLDLLFTPDMSWNTIMQWDNQSDEIGINSRFRWIVEPGREVVLVLNQGLLVDEDHDLRRGVTEPIFKVSWTFRF